MKTCVNSACRERLADDTEVCGNCGTRQPAALGRSAGDTGGRRNQAVGDTSADRGGIAQSGAGNLQQNAPGGNIFNFFGHPGLGLGIAAVAVVGIVAIVAIVLRPGGGSGGTSTPPAPASTATGTPTPTIAPVASPSTLTPTATQISTPKPTLTATRVLPEPAAPAASPPTLSPTYTPTVTPKPTLTATRVLPEPTATPTPTPTAGYQLVWEAKAPDTIRGLTIPSNASFVATLLGQNADQLFLYSNTGDIYYRRKLKFDVWRRVSTIPDGSVVAVNSDRLILMFDPQGNLLEEHPSYPSSRAAASAALTLTQDGSIILVGAGTGRLAFIDRKQGVRREFRFSGSTYGDARVIATAPDGGLGVVADSKFVYYFDRNGVLWQSDLPGVLVIEDVGVTSDGSLIAVGSLYGGGEGAFVYLLDKRGRLLWRYLLQGHSFLDVAISPDGSNILAAGRHEGSRNGFIMGLDQHGSLMWKHDLGIRVSHIAMTSDGAVVVASDGNTLWKMKKR